MNLKLTVLSFFTVTVFIVSIYIVFRDTIVTKFLPMPCGKHESCMRFCCPYNDSCGNDSELRAIEIPFAEQLSENFTIIRGPPHIDLHRHDNWTLLKNGMLMDALNYTYNWNEYCFHFEGNDTALIMTVPPISTVETAKSIFPYLMLSSIPCLIATFVIIALLRELRTMQGKCVMGYVLSLTVMYSTLAAIGLFNQDLLDHFNLTCRSLGYTFLASILMCFFWLNVMCFDTYSAFSSKRLKSGSTKKFLKYCAYAFGIPAIVVITVAALNELEVIPYDYSTGIGIRSCSISDPLNDNSPETKIISNRAQWIYLYGPIMLFLVINCVFYFLTAVTIYHAQRSFKQKFRSGESFRHGREKQRFGQYARLFLLMGLPWSIEIFSWFFDNTIVLYIASIVNCYQGVIIFSMFVLHTRVYKMIVKKTRSSPPKGSSCELSRMGTIRTPAQSSDALNY